MMNRINKIKKYLFVLLQLSWIVLIGFIFVKMMNSGNFETSLGYIIILMVVAFPISIFAAGFTYLIDMLFYFPQNDGKVMVLTILIMGYYQWFIVFPKIINKIREKEKLKEIEKKEQLKVNIIEYRKNKEDYIKSLIIKGFTNEQIKNKVRNFTDDDIDKIRENI